MELRVRAAALAFVAIGAVAIHSYAQQEAPSLPIFRAGTTLVEFSFVATNSSGEPVTDLTRDDISIVQNGQPRTVEFFRFEGAAFAPGAKEASAPREVIAPGIFTNRAEYNPGPARNVTAIVLDTLNTIPEEQAVVRAQVMQYLRVLAPNTRVAVYALGSRLRILHDFTDDHAALVARLEKQKLEYNVQSIPADELVRYQLMEAEHLNDAVDEYIDPDQESDPDAQANAERQAQLDNVKGHLARSDEYFQEQLYRLRMNQTLASLEALGNHLAGIPGRKNLVWISGGLPVVSQQAHDRWVTSYGDEVRSLSRRLATQGVAVYPVQASGLNVGLLGTSSTAPGSSRGQLAELRPMTREHDLRVWGTMDMMADITGGRSVRNSNDLAAGARLAASDMRGSYSVGFYVPEANDNRWREFDVRVKRKDVRIVHRRGYMALAPLKQPVSWAESEWQAAVRNPLGSTAIRLDARAELDGKGSMNVLMQIAADDLYYKRVNGSPVADLEIGFGERNRQEWTRVRRDGAVITVKENPQQAARPSIVRLMKSWTLDPDTSAVRLIVRDRNTGRFGVLDMPLSEVKR